MTSEEIKIGLPVIYFPVVDDIKATNGVITEITSEAWQLGNGEWVCKIKHRVGAVSIKHLKDTHA